MVLQLVETGYTLKVIESERRPFLWTSAPSTLPRFQLRFDVHNTKLMGFTVFASLANTIPFADGSCTLRSALFLSTWRIT